MNKVVTPEQLELTSEKVTELHSSQVATKGSNPSPVNLETVLASASDPDQEDFDWNNPNEDSIILREQRATAVYRNRLGELLIRQRASWDDDCDSVVYLSPENEITFMEGLARRHRES